MQAALAAPNDGYTVFIRQVSTLSTNAANVQEPAHNPLTDFAPISLFPRGPCFIIVPPGSPYKTLADLIADARKCPYAFNYATCSTSVFALQRMAQRPWRAKMRTTAPSTTRARAMPSTPSRWPARSTSPWSMHRVCTNLAKGRRLRALAYTGRQRSPRCRLTSPPSAEAGLPDFLAFNWVAAVVSESAAVDR